jgi:hypothetical protein
MHTVDGRPPRQRSEQARRCTPRVSEEFSDGGEVGVLFFFSYVDDGDNP